eukprot:m.130417 g.130417  ORF g.130417 m.130417 type:complete len:318 (-) comp29476_c0_seq1:107-1060(-)
MGVTAAAASATDAALELKSREAKLLAILLCFSASLIELFTTVDMCTHNESSKNCHHPRLQLPIWLGAVSVILCIARLAFFRYSPQAKNFDVHLSFVLTVCWSFGVAFNTSTGGPFTRTNNGYYSTWICLLATIYFAYLSITSTVRKSLDIEISRQSQSLLIVFFASFVEMAVAADVCNTSTCNSYEAGATAIGLISVCIVGTHLALVKLDHPFRLLFGKIIAPLLVVLWSFGAAFNTSNAGPFTSSCNPDVPAANGYFATWIAFFGCLHYAYVEFLTALPGVLLAGSFSSGANFQASDRTTHDQPYQPIATDDDEDV